jgi:hypothetical protein
MPTFVLPPNMLKLSFIFAMVAADLGIWQSSGTSGVTCVHTALLPNSRLLCFERPHMAPYPPNKNTNGVLSTEIDLMGTVNADGTWTPKITPIAVNDNPFCSGHCQRADGSILVVGGDNQSIDATQVHRVYC